jgi:hypothetical protein
MSSILCYRIEHPDTGLGPYQHRVDGQMLVAIPHTRSTPGWASDRKLVPAIEVSAVHPSHINCYRHAFVSPELALRWFGDPAVRDGLVRAGFQATELSVTIDTVPLVATISELNGTRHHDYVSPTASTAYVGTREVLYRPDFATHRQVVDLATFWQEPERSFGIKAPPRRRPLS